MQYVIGRKRICFFKQAKFPSSSQQINANKLETIKEYCKTLVIISSKEALDNLEDSSEVDKKLLFSLQLDKKSSKINLLIIKRSCKIYQDS